MYQPTPTGLPSPPYPLSIKRASIEDLFNVSYWLWRLNPSSIFPVMLSSAFGVLRESVIVIAIIYGLFQLASAGFFRILLEAFQGFYFQPLILILPQIVSKLIPTIAISIGLLLVISLIAGGFLNSAEYGSYLHVMNTGVLSILDVLGEIKKRWVNMVWTVIVVELIKSGPFILTISWFLLDVLSFPSMDPLLMLGRIISWLQIILLVAVIALILLVLTVYSYPAASAGFHGFAAVRESVKACKKLPVNTIVYALLRVAFTLLIVGITFAFSFLGAEVSSITAVLTSFIATPIFHILKTSLFLKAQPSLFLLPLPIGPPILEDAPKYIWKTGLDRIKRGFKELASFLSEPKNIVFHISSALIFSIGIVLGRYISSLGIGQVVEALGLYRGEVNPLFDTYGLPFLALEISFHNWQASLATALSGIIFMFPTATTLIFNGFILGIVEDMVHNTVMFLVAILPHGIIELPSFILAGSAGLKLGFSFIRVLRHHALSSDPEFIKVLRQTIYIILGLLPLFIVAGIIETFITTRIMRICSWR